MLKATVVSSEKGRVVIMDSITKVTPDDAGAHVVSASHGGVSSGEFALEVPLSSVFFNDAGVGKEWAGIAALAMLEARGVAAGTGQPREREDRRQPGHVGSWRDQPCQQAGRRARARPRPQAEGRALRRRRRANGALTYTLVRPSAHQGRSDAMGGCGRTST